MQALIRSKSAGITGGRGTAGAGPGRDLPYMENVRKHKTQIQVSDSEALTRAIEVRGD